MPLYEFKCNTCKISVEELMDNKNFKDGVVPQCWICHTNMTYISSRPEVLKKYSTYSDYKENHEVMG